MSELKKMKLELPEGITLPEGCELPEVEMTTAILKRTIIGDDGAMVEIEQNIEIPNIKQGD